MNPFHFPCGNGLLDALPESARSNLAGHLERVALRLGDVLHEPGSRMQHAYFPISAIASLHYVMASGASSESSGVGSEGMVGVALFMGGHSTTNSAMVQTSGDAYRLDRRIVKEEFDRAGAFQALMLRYVQALITQTCQTTVCNRHHSVDQQLCRWLLMTLDRVPSGQLVMTQELIASMLGVRREGITGAAGKLQDAGLIRYRRGHITVLGRSGLERRACECYAVVRKEISRLLPGPACMATGHSGIAGR